MFITHLKVGGQFPADKYLLVYFDMIIRNPMYITTAEGHVLSKIYAYMLNDYFAPYLYQALLAENYWQLRLDPDGLILSMWGFSDSIPKGKFLTEIQTLVLFVYYC